MLCCLSCCFRRSAKKYVEKVASIELRLPTLSAEQLLRVGSAVQSELKGYLPKFLVVYCWSLTSLGEGVKPDIDKLISEGRTHADQMDSLRKLHVLLQSPPMPGKPLMIPGTTSPCGAEIAGKVEEEKDELMTTLILKGMNILASSKSIRQAVLDSLEELKKDLSTITGGRASPQAFDSILGKAVDSLIFQGLKAVAVQTSQAQASIEATPKALLEKTLQYVK